jgi:bifunctional DNA-binding transcriptional regulator/antitoxin component of YhaV-PrlF toxin-antitoxin module
MQKQAKITSKGQITVPREVRRLLGVRPGDRLRPRSRAASWSRYHAKAGHVKR